MMNQSFFWKVSLKGSDKDLSPVIGELSSHFKIGRKEKRPTDKRININPSLLNPEDIFEIFPPVPTLCLKKMLTVSIKLSYIKCGYCASRNKPLMKISNSSIKKYFENRNFKSTGKFIKSNGFILVKLMINFNIHEFEIVLIVMVITASTHAGI